MYGVQYQYSVYIYHILQREKKHNLVLNEVFWRKKVPTSNGTCFIILQLLNKDYKEYINWYVYYNGYNVKNIYTGFVHTTDYTCTHIVFTLNILTMPRKMVMINDDMSVQSRILQSERLTQTFYHGYEVSLL